MPNMTKVELEPISNGTRGMVNYISRRHNPANNRYLKSYDLQKKSKYIIYLDANNLYGYPIFRFLPTSGL